MDFVSSLSSAFVSVSISLSCIFPSDTDDKESETKIESEDHGTKTPKSDDATGELYNDGSSDSDETDETEKHTAEGGQV